MNNMETKKPQVAILSRSFGAASKAPFECLDKNGIAYTVKHNSQPQNEQLVAQLIGNADAAILGSDVINAYVLDHCPNLKIISKHGVGLDAIDLDLAEKRKVKVCCTKDANNETVADLTVLMMLALKRQLRQNVIREATPSWKSKELTHDLFEATVGLVGYGHIGYGVARRLAGFKAKILVYDPYVKPEHITTPDTHLVTLKELLAQSDVVSLHLPLNKDTELLINREAIAGMKDGAIIINTSRGGIMDYEALYEALKTGKLAGAGLDVFPQEPPKDMPIITLDNVVATPHIATHTKESNNRMGVAAAQNVVDYFKNSCSA